MRWIRSNTYILIVQVCNWVVIVIAMMAFITVRESVTLDRLIVRVTIDGKLTAQDEITTPSEVKAGGISA